MTDISDMPQVQPSGQESVVDFASMHSNAENAYRFHRTASLVGAALVGVTGVGEALSIVNHVGGDRFFVTTFGFIASLGATIHQTIEASRAGSRAAQFEVAALQAGQIQGPQLAPSAAK